MNTIQHNAPSSVTGLNLTSAAEDYYWQLNHCFPDFAARQAVFRKQIHLAQRMHAADMACIVFGCPVSNRGFSQFLIWVLFGTESGFSNVKFLVIGHILCAPGPWWKIYDGLVLICFAACSIIRLDFFRILYRTTQMKKKWRLSDYWNNSDRLLTEIRLEWGINPIE